MLIISVLVVSSCANPVPPSGGEKDVTPPGIKKIFPANGTVNFNSASIQIDFDEYIVYSNSGNEVTIAPPMTVDPSIKVKGKQLVVEFKEDLMPNTTYTINFGSSIKDFHEGNVLGQYKYVFSTGEYLDSIELSGTVLNGFDGVPLGEMLVGLYVLPDIMSDSALVNESAYYWASTNEKGEFLFENIKVEDYWLAAFEDKNFNKRLDAGKEKVGWIGQEFGLAVSATLTEPLRLYEEEVEVRVKEVENPKPGHVYFTFNKQVEQIALDPSNYLNGDIVYFNELNDTLHYWYQEGGDVTFYVELNESVYDTIELNLDYVDELGVGEVSVGRQSIPENQGAVIRCDYPMSTINQSLVQLTNAQGESIAYEIMDADVVQEIIIKGDWAKDDTLTMTIDSLAISNYLGNAHQNFSTELYISGEETPASVTLLFSETAAVNYYIQLLKEDKRVIENTAIGGLSEFTFNDQPKGNYHIRIYEDYNGNGKWNAGDYINGITAEPTLFFSEPIELRPNWDQELEVQF